MNSTNTSVEQMAKYYWGTLGAASTTTTGAGAATSGLIRSSWPPPAAHGHGGGEPSWGELTFARDAAGGGCVWPPRSYTCTFCRREFRSAQALGGHMNVHRRDRARLRQCASPSPPDHDQEPIATPLAAPESADRHQLLQLEGSPLFRTTKLKAAAVLISGFPAYHHHHQTYNYNNNSREAVISTPAATTSRYIPTTLVKESKSKVLISIPAATVASKEAAIAIIGDEEEEEIMVAGRTKRRRVVVHQPPFPSSPFYDLRRLPASSPNKGGVEHDAKVPKVTTTTSPSSLSLLHHLAQGRQEEVDLELRLGTS